MGAKGKPKTGGKVKEWIAQLWVKLQDAKITESEERLLFELLKAAVPYTDRKQPTEIESDNSHSFPTSIDITFTEPKEGK